MAISLRPHESDVTAPTPPNRKEERDSRLIQDAWRQGLLSDEELEAAKHHLEEFGVPFLVSLR